MRIDIDKNLLPAAAELRLQAEERLRAKTVGLHPSRTKQEVQRLVHELEVHQIELEMQNEELHRAQEELEVSRNKYAELYDFAPVGYFVFDADGLIREVNLAGAQLLGIERRMLANKHFIRFIADAVGREIFAIHLETVLQKQVMQRCELRLTRNDGTEIHSQLRSVTLDTIGSKNGYILCSIVDGTVAKQLAEDLQTAHDKLELIVHERTRELIRTNVQLTQEIEERKRAENTLRAQEHELATIFENAPFMMFLLDEDRRVCRVNALACSFTGSSTADMIDQRIGVALHCLHVQDSPANCGFGPNCQQCKIKQTVVDTFKAGLTQHPLETKLTVSIDGKEQEIIFLYSTTRVNVRNLPMVLLSLQDNTEHRKLEAQFRQSQKMESIGTFSGGIAHDFNNILTVIIGYGQITIMDMSEDNPYRQNLEQIIAAADRAAHLTRDLLLFSRKQSSDKKTIDLNKVIRSLEKFLVRVIGEDISCKTVLADKAMPVFADAHHLEQVLMNLATNARDAMAKGGDFTIAVEQTNLDHAFIAFHGFGNSGMYAVLTVTDTGTGMDEETRQHIFDPFFTTKEVGKGTGLGLSVIFGIVKDHDGFINVYSEPGKGTAFRIYLPLIASMAGKEEMKSDKKHPNMGTETILLAEDDETVRNMTLSLLEGFGYEVIVVVDGEDAVLKFRENRERIQLLLFDMNMPKKNGKEAYDNIREIEPDIKVIFASGYASDTVHQKVPFGDNVIMISKPYLPSNLLAMVRSVLDRGRSLEPVKLTVP